MKKLVATLYALGLAAYGCVSDDETLGQRLDGGASLDATSPVQDASVDVSAKDASVDALADSDSSVDAPSDATDGAVDAALDSALDASDACARAPGLVGWWPGDGIAEDIAGASEGTLQGGATYTAGKAEQAFSFDGVDDYVELAPQAALDVGANDFTVDVWFNLASLVTDQTFFQKLSGTLVTDPSYFIEFNTPNALRFAVLETDVNRNDLIVTTTLTTGTWHHFAAVRSGNTSTLYLDGAAIGNKTAGVDVNTGAGGAARIGRTAHNTAITRFVNGALDELEVYNRALSLGEVQALFATGPTRCK